jgi:hypothetical protein
MADIQEQTREQLMRVVNDIIYLAHRIRVPSRHVKEIIIDHIFAARTIEGILRNRRRAESK